MVKLISQIQSAKSFFKICGIVPDEPFCESPVKSLASRKFQRREISVESRVMIHILRKRATAKHIKDMLEAHKSYIKLAVDIKQGILAGGGEFHADCEAALVEEGSARSDVWGADWVPDCDEIKFGAMINIRPKENRSMDIQDEHIRKQIKQVVRKLLRRVP